MRALACAVGGVSLAMAPSCAGSKDECVQLGTRAEALKQKQATVCGATDHIDEPKNVEIAACLVEHLEACEPAWASFLAKRPGGELSTAHFVFVDASCAATLLVMLDPEAPDDPFTEVVCEGLEATGEATVVVTASMCREKIVYPFCDDP